MPSYLTQLEAFADASNVTLLQAFKWAEVPHSTYYRTIRYHTELSHLTACRVAQAIENHNCLERMKADIRKHRRIGREFDIKTMKKRHKPRIAGPHQPVSRPKKQ